MRNRSLFAESLAAGAGLRRRACLVMLLAMCLGWVGLDSARAEGREIDYERRRQRILEADTGTKIGGELTQLLRTSRASHPEVYGQVVGVLLAEDSRTAQLTPERRRMLFAALIAHMIDSQPDSDSILLLPTIVKRLAADKALIARVQEDHLGGSRLSERQPGWDRLMRRTITLIDSEDQALRAAAIRLAAHAHREDTAPTVAAFYERLRAGERKATPEDVEAYLDAAEHLLLHRFADLGSLVNFLNPFAASQLLSPDSREWTKGDKENVRAELYRAVIGLQRERGGEQASKERHAALDYGRAVIERAKGPSDLLVFFDPERERIAELQQAALQKADTLAPKPTQAWADLLIAALDHSDHMAVLEQVVALLTKTFTEPSEPGQLLATAVARRLAAGGESDRIDLREKLATVLGRIGTAKDVRDALEGRARIPDDPQQAVWSRLIRALGTVADGQVLWLRPHYQPTAAREAWERLAVAETLGQQGFRSREDRPNLESPRAALFLMHILHGWPGAVVNVSREVKEGDTTSTVSVAKLFVDDGTTNELESDEAKAAFDAGDKRFEFGAGNPDASDAVREEAAKSLLFHAGPQAAAALARAADEDNDVGAAALRTLGLQLRRGDDHAAAALARLIEEGPSESRLLATLDVIIRTPAPSGRTARARLGTAVVDLLNRGGPEAVRRRAAAAGAHLGQLGALKPVYLVWKDLTPAEDEERYKVWSGLLRDVVGGIARAGAKEAKLDLDFRTAVREMLSAHAQHVGLFARILGDLGTDAARFELKRFRAELLMQHVGIGEGHTIDERRAELDMAIALYQELAAEARAERSKARETVAAEMERFRYDALHQRWGRTFLKTGEGGDDVASIQLDAIEAAIASGNGDAASRAQQSEVAELQKRQQNEQLTKEQTDRLAKLLPALAKITASAEPPAKKDDK